MQEVSGVVGTNQRPVILLPPLVGTHHEEFYGLGLGKVVGNVLEEIVVPAQSSLIFVKWRGRAKIYIADLATGASVPANHDQEMLSSARCFVLAMQFHADIVAQ